MRAQWPLCARFNRNTQNIHISVCIFPFCFQVNLMISDLKRAKHTQGFLSNNCVKVSLRDSISSCVFGDNRQTKPKCVYRISVCAFGLLYTHYNLWRRNSMYGLRNGYAQRAPILSALKRRTTIFYMVTVTYITISHVMYHMHYVRRKNTTRSHTHTHIRTQQHQSHWWK